MTLAEKPQDLGVDDPLPAGEPDEGLASKQKPHTRDAAASASASRPLPSGERWGVFGFARKVIVA